MYNARHVATAHVGDQTEVIPQGASQRAFEALAEELDSAGYAEFLACFDPVVRSPTAWRAARGCAPPSLGPIVDLLLVGEAVRPPDLPEVLQELVPQLIAGGLLKRRADGLVETVGTVVLLVCGNWLICQPPQANPLFYIGEDSLALLGHIRPGAAQTCLDLCTGPGLHAVHCARFVPNVTAVELDPTVARLAQLNAALNGVADRVEILSGNLYEPVASQQFDLITANPPTLPYPADLPSPRIGHGGGDGLRVMARVLAGLPDALTDRGRAHLVGMTLADGRSERLREWLATMAQHNGMDIRCSVLSHSEMRAGGAFFERMVSAVANIAAADQEQIIESYIRLLQRLQASHLSTYFLQVVPGLGTLELTDVSSVGRQGQWHV